MILWAKIKILHNFRPELEKIADSREHVLLGMDSYRDLVRHIQDCRPPGRGDGGGGAPIPVTPKGGNGQNLRKEVRDSPQFLNYILGNLAVKRPPTGPPTATEVAPSPETGYGDYESVPGGVPPQESLNQPG